MIDLHSHTIHSDGDRSPDYLLAEAAAAGVTVLSVTDHDTVSGIPECRIAAKRHGVRLVPGIELSCELHGREVHILGHFLDDASPALGKLAGGMTREQLMEEYGLKATDVLAALRYAARVVSLEHVRAGD